jgi:predicted DNA-binding transcriptional regulator AlpA
MKDHLRLMTEREFCHATRLSRTVVWRLRQAGKLPYVAIGGSIRYTEDHLRQLVKIYERTLPPQNEGKEQKRNA